MLPPDGQHRLAGDRSPPGGDPPARPEGCYGSARLAGRL